ncbi:hypothetical protein [Microbacterium sp. NC79]|uniref:hypothetical protein n=1 Tax=Microbacterium sp. NC79 TaxID=2851009 RepID=UPI001C2B7BAF|nr:hypothetical protein [Microbacterium sp. NC79]MBV0894071.1 hypothetical protein [Microbacterium sp. NC79]
MKINFLGNSHLGTIAPALTKAGGAREISHFISRTYGTVDATVVGPQGDATIPWIKLTESTHYGHTIDLGAADVAVAVGFNFSLVQIVKLWESFQPVDAIGDYGVPSLGEHIWDKYVDAALDATFMMRTLKMLKEVGSPHLVVIPQPAPAEWVSTRDGDRFAIYRDLVRNGDWDRVRGMFDRQVRRLEADDVRVFEQPSDTLTEHGFTKDALAMGNPAETAEDSFYARGDFYHMNRTFAGHVAPAFYEWLDEAIPS